MNALIAVDAMRMQHARIQRGASAVSVTWATVEMEKLASLANVMINGVHPIKNAYLQQPTSVNVEMGYVLMK